MFKIYIKAIVILLLLQTTASANGKIRVVTTITPMAFFIENIGGEKVEVTALIPPGANPHTYEPKPRQLNIISSADLFVKVGSGIGFELLWMKRIRSLNKKMPVCDASRGIHLINISGRDHGHNTNKDPHIWLSPENAVIMTENILRAIRDLDPANAGFYRKNALLLINRLKSLKNEISNKFKNIKNRQFFVVHPAWGYFARDFNLKQNAIKYEGKEPTPARLARLIERARDENIKVIFASPQFSIKSADVIANEIHGKIVFIDPMSRDYINNLRHTANVLLESMK